jgi:hypothetical protein
MSSSIKVASVGLMVAAALCGGSFVAPARADAPAATEAPAPPQTGAMQAPKVVMAPKVIHVKPAQLHQVAKPAETPPPKQ